MFKEKKIGEIQKTNSNNHKRNRNAHNISIECACTSRVFFDSSSQLIIIQSTQWYLFDLRYLLLFSSSKFKIRTHIDPVTKCKFYYTPRGRFIHTPPRCPRTDWANDFGRPWWKDDSYCIGVLSAKTRRVRIINTLTSQEQAIEVNCYIVVSNLKCYLNGRLAISN